MGSSRQTSAISKNKTASPRLPSVMEVVRVAHQVTADGGLVARLIGVLRVRIRHEEILLRMRE